MENFVEKHHYRAPDPQAQTILEQLDGSRFETPQPALQTVKEEAVGRFILRNAISIELGLIF